MARWVANTVGIYLSIGRGNIRPRRKAFRWMLVMLRKIIELQSVPSGDVCERLHEIRHRLGVEAAAGRKVASDLVTPNRLWLGEFCRREGSCGGLTVLNGEVGVDGAGQGGQDKLD